MKGSWAALAVALVAIVAVAGCNDYGNTFQNNTGAILSFLSPSQIPACPPAPATCVDLTLMLNGNGFVLKTVVQWNGKPLATTVAVDSTGAALGNLVTAVVPAALLAKPGTATVLTKNPASGAGQNGLSNTVTFIIDNPSNPVPSVSAVSPTCAAPGVDLPLVVTGTNFLSASGGSSQVSTLIWTFGGSQFQFTAPAATITTTQITVTIPKADASAAGSRQHRQRRWDQHPFSGVQRHHPVCSLSCRRKGASIFRIVSRGRGGNARGESRRALRRLYGSAG